MMNLKIKRVSVQDGEPEGARTTVIAEYVGADGVDMMPLTFAYDGQPREGHVVGNWLRVLTDGEVNRERNIGYEEAKRVAAAPAGRA